MLKRIGQIANVIGLICLFHILFVNLAPPSICKLTRVSDHCLDTGVSPECGNYLVDGSRFDFSSLDQGGWNSDLCDIIFIFLPIATIFPAIAWILLQFLNRSLIVFRRFRARLSR